MWNLFEAAEAGDPAIRLIYRTENLSALIPEEFLEDQRSILPAPVFAREHQNLWGQRSDVFCTADDWDRAIEDGDPRRDCDTGPCSLFVDLGWVKDETAIAVGKREGEKTAIIALETFQGSKGRLVSFFIGEQRIRELSKFLSVKYIEIESPQRIMLAENIQIDGVRVEVLHPHKEQSETVGETLHRPEERKYSPTKRPGAQTTAPNAYYSDHTNRLEGC